MHTINGISIAGVPWGTKWANICCVLLIQPKIIKLNQRGKAKVRVITICLVLVKIYGNNPKKLLNIIIENNEIKIKDAPLLIFLFPIRVLNSWCRINIILFHMMKCRDGINQYVDGININPKIVLNQLMDRLFRLVDGSKTENRFLIIFNLFYL